MTSISKALVLVGSVALAAASATTFAEEIQGGSTTSATAMSSDLRAVTQSRLDAADGEKNKLASGEWRLLSKTLFPRQPNQLKQRRESKASLYFPDADS